MSEEKIEGLNFIEEIIEKDIASGKHDGRVLTRFPQNLMVIFTLVMLRLFVLILD